MCISLYLEIEYEYDVLCPVEQVGKAVKHRPEGIARRPEGPAGSGRLPDNDLPISG